LRVAHGGTEENPKKRKISKTYLDQRDANSTTQTKTPNGLSVAVAGLIIHKTNEQLREKTSKAKETILVEAHARIRS